MSEIRSILNKLDSLNQLNEAEDIVVRRVQSNGTLINVNINRDDPSKYFTGLRSGGASYSRDDIVRVYYTDEERLQRFLDSTDGRRAIEVDRDGNPIEAPQTDDELDNDSVDSSDETGDDDQAPQTDAELDADSEDATTSTRLSDGSTFDPGNERSRTLAAQRAGQLLDRYRELMRKMNESAPVSLRGSYLKDYNLYEAFLLEALTAQESGELANIITDLNTLINAEGLLSSQNRELFRREIADAPDVAELRAANGTNITDFERDAEDEEDADSADSGDDTEVEQPPEEAEEVSDDSGDQDATVDPGEAAPAGSLEAFANSGKGGLANDADETQAIEELQQFLTDYGFDPNGVDGRYGNGTIAAVRRFQEAFGVTVDGDAGPETIGKIVEFRNDMTEMDELIAAAGPAPSNESFSFRHLIDLVEGKLFEALDDAQRTRVEELIAKYEDIIPNLPQSAQDTVNGKITSLRTALEAPADTDTDTEEPAETNPANMDDAQKATAIHEGIDGMGTDEEAVLAVLGSIADEAELDRVKSAFQQLYNEDMMDWINSEVSFSDQDAVDNIINRITGDPDAPQTVEDIVGASEAADALDDAMNGGFFFGLGTEEQAILEILGRISARDFPTVMSEYERKVGVNLLTDLESELSGEDRNRVNDIIKRFGYEFQDEDPGYREIGGEEGAEEGGEEGAEEGGEEGAAASTGEAVYKAVRGSGQSRRYTTYDANGNEVSTGRGVGPQLPTREEWEAQNSSAGEEGGEDAEGETGAETDATGAEGETGAETDPELPTVTNAPSPEELEQLEIDAAEQRILDSFDDEAINLAWPTLSDADKQLLADLLQRAGRPVPGITTNMSTGPVEDDF